MIFLANLRVNFMATQLQMKTPDEREEKSWKHTHTHAQVLSTAIQQLFYNPAKNSD